MTTSFRVTCFVVLLTILSCGKKASDPVGTTTTSGNTRAVIKSGTTTVAYVVSWIWASDRVVIYIPSVDRYATINLETGAYEHRNHIPHDYYLLFSADACAGTPTAVTGPFAGEIGKTIIFDGANGLTGRENLYQIQSS